MRTIRQKRLEKQLTMIFETENKLKDRITIATEKYSRRHEYIRKTNPHGRVILLKKGPRI